MGRRPLRGNGQVAYAKSGESTHRAKPGGVSTVPSHGAYEALPGAPLYRSYFQRERSVRNIWRFPLLTYDQIFVWADAHYSRLSEWPQRNSGPVFDAPLETWSAIDMAFAKGNRGLPAGSSLAQFLNEQRGTRNRMALPPLTLDQILGWADKHNERTGAWPTEASGLVLEKPGETWKGVQVALVKGNRGLPGGFSLAKLLAQERSVRNRKASPLLTTEQILAWADSHFRAKGEWPSSSTGPILGVSGETWAGINHAFRRGSRGLSEGSSLARLLADERQVPNVADNRAPPQRKRSERQPPLSEDQIVTWADAHYSRTGQWPGQASGPILDAPGETWAGINHALSRGSAG